MKQANGEQVECRREQSTYQLTLQNTRMAMEDHLAIAVDQERTRNASLVVLAKIYPAKRTLSVS
jgi:hypothetical protein